MRKVTVSIPEVHYSYITIEVDDNDDDQAMKEKANLLLEAGDYQDNLENSHTMDMAMWDITDEEFLHRQIALTFLDQLKLNYIFQEYICKAKIIL